MHTDAGQRGRRRPIEDDAERAYIDGLPEPENAFAAIEVLIACTTIQVE